MKRSLLGLTALVWHTSAQGCYTLGNGPPNCPRTPTLKLHCSAPGSVTPFEPYVGPNNPWGVADTCIANSEGDYGAACYSQESFCKVFAYDTSTGLCSLFKYAMKSKDFQRDETSTTLFSRNGCSTEATALYFGNIQFWDNFPGSTLSLVNDYRSGASPVAAPTTVSLDNVAADDDCSAVQQCMGQIPAPDGGSAAYVYYNLDNNTWMCNYWDNDVYDELFINPTADESVGRSYFYW